MGKRLTTDDIRQSLNAHAATKGAEVFEKYGPRIGWKELLQILADPSCTRYPCEIRFDASPLQPGEFAYPVPRGELAEAGFVICVHPVFEATLERVPLLALYQLVQVLYGEFATAADAETFGSEALGISKDDYYRSLCELADQLSAEAA